MLFKKDPNILHDMVTMISPAFLIQNGVSGNALNGIGSCLQDFTATWRIYTHIAWELPRWVLYWPKHR